MTEVTLTPVITIALDLNSPNFTYAVEELNNLVEANNMEVAETLTQKLDRSDPATYFGKGKIEELKELVIETGVDTVIANDELLLVKFETLKKLSMPESSTEPV
ncbi:hypothetical protein [Lentilactobacillus senioris]|uniref:HflX-like GTP-binding protein n=1 Tax=Lentilactobacillus senioris TaxID=931534 RepID=UPI000AA542E2